ncbi:Xylulose kinase [bioreactor metagenome]|uniref:Xylulose kinase n=1 Tax=bioreactor metagenome TaxID=1076179 RepID=A0A644WXN2_9ZZZZ
MTFIGIDLGTSSVKVILADRGGRILNTVTKEYPLSFPHPGWSEQNPSDWWNRTADAVRELLSGFDPGEVAGISFGGQMHGLVILDKEDRVIRPAILWNDGRTSAETRYLNEVVGEANLARWTGNIAFAGFTAPKLLWVKSKEPENFKKIRKIMLPKDYLAYRMTGTFCTDVSDASGMLLLDVAHKCWSKQMLEVCGISAGQLPKLYESYEAVGTLLPDAAMQLGLPDTVKVIAGAGDNAAAAIGTGTVSDGDCNLSIGTSGTVFIASDKFKLPGNHAIHAFAHANGKYHLMGCMLSAASCYKWWMDEILRSDAYGREQDAIRELGNNSILFAPYFMGERTPHNDTEVRGAFIGLSLGTKREDMTQAILEGVAFAIRDSVEIARSLGIDIKKTRICGGGAKSTVWKTIIANVLQIPVESIETDEGPALGAAMLAAVGCGVYQSAGEFADLAVNVTDVVYPDEKIAKRYDVKYLEFLKLYPAIRDIRS